MVLGAGVCQSGTSFAGYGSPDLSPEIQGNTLELTNPTGMITGSTADANYINPLTGDYMIDQNGQLVGMPSVAQQVYLALLTQLGSSANPDVGSTLYQLKTIGTNFQAQVQHKVNLALSNLIKANVISLNSTFVTLNKANSNTVTAIVVNWTDLTTSKSYSTSLT